MFIINSKRRKYPVGMRFRTRVYGPGIQRLHPAIPNGRDIDLGVCVCVWVGGKH